MLLKALGTCIFIVLIPVCVKGQCLSAIDSIPTYNTKSPIHIDFSNVTFAKSFTPITLFSGFFDFLDVRNEGNTIEAYANETIDRSFITGGVLCNKKYKFHKIGFTINQNILGRGGHTILGFKTPLEAVAVYYDPTCGSFKNALGKPGGVVQVFNPVVVGPVPNPFFIPFQLLLLSGALKEPGSSFPFLCPLVFSWFDALSLNPAYVAYIGSYYHAYTDDYYPGAINIIPSNVPSFISFNQFAAFKNALALNGKPLELVPPIYPQDRPISVGFGFLQGFVPV